ncbi:YdcF family protein [Bernardetia sp.]|uniref:YdcF family protein n=1 Tax=Bernardetia sp. TaxID=1937974 RepID=UPI0025C1B445|nr:YdcF family protein [Bernardetia sp.]
MFYFLSKTLFYFLMPITWITLFLLIAVFSKKWRTKSLKIGVVLFLVVTNPFLANEMYLLWEVAPTPIKKVENYQIGIVLTGMSNSGKEPKDRVYAQAGIDRLLQAIRLYKEGKIKKILVVGMSEEINLTTGEEKLPKRTYKYKDMLQDMCIAEEDILIESLSKNTYENAQFSAIFLKEKLNYQPNNKNQILVITSAFHLRRALGCFEKAGLKVDGFSTDFMANERKNMLTLLNLIPTEDAMAKWGKIIHEIVGYIVYDITGKL